MKRVNSAYMSTRGAENGDLLKYKEVYSTVFKERLCREHLVGPAISPKWQLRENLQMDAYI
jgi:hypothetical protein